MSNKPLCSVSVVIPTRNRREWLSETIAALVAQTFSDWELVVVDDASADDTLAYVRSLTDPRVRILARAQQGGQLAANNDGLALATGEFIMFLDDDDLLRRDTLARLVEALRQHPEALAACGGCRLFRENGDSHKVYRPARMHIRDIWRELLFGWWSNSGQNLFRTSVVKDIGGYQQEFVQVIDRRLWFEITYRGPVCIVPFMAMDYRQHDGQISKWAHVDRQRQKLWAHVIDELPPRHRDEARRIRRAAVFVEQAEAARGAGQFVRALATYLRACVAAPALVVSPLTGRPLWWGIKKSALRQRTP